MGSPETVCIVVKSLVTHLEAEWRCVSDVRLAVGMQEAGSLRVQLYGRLWILPLMRVHFTLLSLQSLLNRELWTRYTPHLLGSQKLTLLGWSELSGKLNVSCAYAWCMCGNCKLIPEILVYEDNQ